MNSPYVRKLDPASLQAHAPAADAEKAISVNNESQLFADDWLIQSKTSVHRRLNRPARIDGAVMFPEKPWEGQAVVYGSVVREVSEFRMYYRGWIQPPPPSGGPYCHSPVCVARSTDGIHFHRDPIDGAACPGTNIVINHDLDDFCLLKDTAESNPAKRYKVLAYLFGKWQEDGLTPGWSADGIRWTWGRRCAVKNFGDRCSYWYDPVRRKHVAWSRNSKVIPGRIVMHSESDDFETWSDQPRLALRMDRLDHPGVEFYSAFAFWYHSMYLGYLEVYHAHLQRLDTQLIGSRDGLHWERLGDREAFLPNGTHGAFDAYWVVPTYNPPVVDKERLLIHYNGRPDPHVAKGFHHVMPGMGGSFGVAELRDDGFISLDATGAEGVVETKLLSLPAGARRLEVNACPFNRRPGYDLMRLQIEVLTSSGAVVSAHEARPPHDADVVWHVIETEDPFPENVRVRFRMQNCRLYSFRFRAASA